MNDGTKNSITFFQSLERLFQLSLLLSTISRMKKSNRCRNKSDKRVHEMKLLFITKNAVNVRKTQWSVPGNGAMYEFFVCDCASVSL